MFCPRCGQEQVSDETRFCSRCGFLLTGTAVVLSNNGALPQSASRSSSTNSPRKRGLKQGLFVFLLTFLLVPLVAILSKGLNITPIFVAIIAILLPVGGLLRMAYALMFESSDDIDGSPIEGFQGFEGKSLRAGSLHALPPQQSTPATDYVSPPAGTWRDTNELKTPASVTEETTKLLHKEQDQ